MDSEQPLVIRPRGPLIMATVALVVMIGAVVLALATRSGAEVPTIAVGLAVGAAVWMVLINPHVEISDTDVRVVNPMRTYRVAFSALRDVRTKWSLTLVADDMHVVAWSAPAPGGRLSVDADDVARHARARLPRAAIHPDGTVRPADLAGTDSGDAAAAVRMRWATLMESGELDEAAPSPVVRQWNIASIAILIIAVFLVVWTSM